MSKQAKGFTLIELVVVITILGILAAFAIPRFAGLEQNARIAAINGLAGSVRAAASLAHSVALVTGATASQTVAMEGSNVTMANFYPAATTAGITAALQDTSGFNDQGDGQFQFDGAPDEPNCYVDYTAAGVGGVPVVDTETSGC